MNFPEELKKRILVYDGSKGYLLQQYGLPAGAAPDSFNVQKPEIVRRIHEAYVEAGCDVIQTNTFTANRILLGRHGLEGRLYDINCRGAEIAVEAAGDSVLVSASIGPTGLMFRPFGELDYDTAYDVFSEQISALCDGGADILNFETFTDIIEMKAALNAAKDICDLPVICSMAFEENRRTLMGTDALTAARILLKAGADVVGANCSFGPSHMLDIIKEMSKTGTCLSVKPNAGLPVVEDGNTIYRQCPADFVRESAAFMDFNARLIGGCCGTTPEFIRMLKKEIRQEPASCSPEEGRVICSSSGCIDITETYTSDVLEIEDDAGYLDVSEELTELSFGGLDVLELRYNGGDAEMLKNAILGVHASVKQPFILSGRNEEAIRKALAVNPGIAGLREDIPGARGYELV